MSSFFSSLSKQPASQDVSSLIRSTPTGTVTQGRSKDVRYKTVIVTRRVKRAPIQQSMQSSGRGNYQTDILRRLKKRKKDRVSGTVTEKEKEEKSERKRAPKKEKGEKKQRESKKSKSKEFITSEDDLSDVDDYEDEEEEDEEEVQAQSSGDEESASKRVKLSPSADDSKVDSTRSLLAADIFEMQSESPAIIHSFDALSRDTPGYVSLFPDDADEDFIDLKYPGIADFTERFYLGTPSKDDYDSVAEIVNIMETVAELYLPYDEAQKIHTSDLQDCITRRVKRAVKRKSLYALKNSIEEYNIIIESTFHNTDNAVQNKEFLAKNLGKRKNITALSHEVLSEIYARVVSPHVKDLRKYEAFSSNVYGELLPRFVSRLFSELEMDSSSIFMDLGSGVGNCVLQAALELGCRCFGCEMMPKAAALAERQEKEFKERLKLWGVMPGETTLITGDFVTSEEVAAAFKSVTVLVCGNFFSF